MKHKSYNFLLSLIAINLTIISLSTLEIWPTIAHANIDVPFFDDTQILDVNIVQIDGRRPVTYFHKNSETVFLGVNNGYDHQVVAPDLEFQVKSLTTEIKNLYKLIDRKLD